MAKMPDLETFAQPVRVEGARPVASYDLSPLARGNAAMQQGVETLGKGAQAVGTDIAGVVANDKLTTNRYEHSIADASVSIDLSKTTDSLKHDTDYATLPDRYLEQAQVARDRWAGTISDPRARALFVAQTDGRIAQGHSQMKEHAFNLETQAKVADLDDRGKALSDIAIANPMDATKFAASLEQFGNIADSLVEQGRLTATDAADRKDKWADMTGLGVGYARVKIDPQGAENEARAAPGSPEQIVNRIMENEGPGKDPRSSAVGGFIDKTWLDLIKARRPDLAAGRSESDLLALRADTGLRREMTAAYIDQSAQYLKGQGIPVSPGALYLSHVLGPGAAAAVLKADPKKPVADVLMDVYGGDARKVQAIIDANPKVLGGQLAGSVVGWANGKMGGAIPGGGSFYDWMSDTHRRAVVNAAHAVMDENALTSKSELQNRVKDTLAEAAQNGTTIRPVSQSEFIAAWGIEQGSREYKDYTANLQFANDVTAVGRLSPAEQDRLVESYKAIPPGPGFAGAADRRDGVAAAVKAARKQLGEDPASYAINRIPAVKASLSTFDQVRNDPTSTPLARQNAARDFANMTTIEQHRLGVAPENVQIVPTGYLEKLNAQLLTPDKNGGASQIASRLQSEATLWGDRWPDIYRQLAPKTEPIVRVLGAGVEPAAANRLINSLNVKEADLLKNQDDPPGTAAKLTRAVDTNLASFYKSLSGSDRDMTATDFRTIATRLATLYLGDSQVSGDVDKAAKKAADDLVNFKYNYKDTYRIPKDPHIDADLVQAGATEARRLIGDGAAAGGALAVAPKTDLAFPGRTDLVEDTAERARNNGVWLTDPREGGLVLFQADGTAVRRQDGKPLSLSWQQLSELGQTRSAASAAFVKALTAGVAP